MSAAIGTDDPEVERCVTELVGRLARRVPDMVSLIEASVCEEIPELAPDEAQIALLDAAIRGNVETILYALRHAIAVEDVPVPTAAVEHTRRLAQHGIPLNALIRGYRLGQRRLTHMAFDELRDIDVGSETHVRAVELITDMLFTYVDWMTQQIIGIYEEERERWLESTNSVRAVRVREVLAGQKHLEVDSASTVIQYPFRCHHIGLVLWFPEVRSEADELNRLVRFVRELSAAVQTAASPLFVATDRASGWAWLPFHGMPVGGVEAIKRFVLQRSDSPRVTIGSPAAGVEGFRRSHDQAEAARPIALACPDPDAAAVAGGDPGLAVAAMLGGDGNIEKARIWVGEVLGGLATPTVNDALLRETLRTFLGCGGSYKLAAEQLVVHTNTVKYRVRRALIRRGRPITSDRLDVEVALLLCRWYANAVLSQDTNVVKAS
jgi:DNA-binding PucR family transcriptional regulator